MASEIEKDLRALRPCRTIEEVDLFGPVEKPWEDHWWGMPEFSMQDASPYKRLTVNFAAPEDYQDFVKATGLQLTGKSDSAWFPKQKPLVGEYFYDGEPTPSRYPVCIPSKGRAKYQKTGKVLERMGVPHLFFVEEHEAEEYRRELGESRVIAMPFRDLGQGSIPARNYIWEWAKEQGFKRHWTVDDNIVSFARCHNNRRLCVYGGAFFPAMEDFVDRYENIAMAGPHHKGFVRDRHQGLSPYLLNSRVYSCILLDTSLPHRWRGRYNEDTDLSLRLLKDGYCTLLFRSLLMDKATTVGVRNAKPLPGGNTDNVYNIGDYRLAFAESLRDQHPDVVKVVWKFNRWHHEVNYAPFRGNAPKLKPGFVKTLAPNNYGMTLHRKAKA